MASDSREAATTTRDPRSVEARLEAADAQLGHALDAVDLEERELARAVTEAVQRTGEALERAREVGDER